MFVRYEKTTAAVNLTHPDKW